MDTKVINSTRNGQERVFDLQRRVVSHMVSESWLSIPHVSYLYEPDISLFYDEYVKLGKNGEKITFNTLLLYVVTEGLKAAPELNSIIKYHHAKGEGSLRVCSEINIVIPWLLEDGRMITPVLCGAQAMTLSELSAGILDLQKKISNTDIDELLYRAVFTDTVNELKRLHLGILKRVIAGKISFHGVRGLQGSARRDYYKISSENRLTEDNLTSGTVTVSNIGSLYKGQKGHFGLLEIIPPQIFAVGLGAVQEKPGVFLNEMGKSEIGIRKYLPMCFVFDHRAVDFNALTPFLKRMDEIFGHPEEIRKW